jgi:hypothetical protein
MVVHGDLHFVPAWLVSMEYKKGGLDRILVDEDATLSGFFVTTSW